MNSKAEEIRLRYLYRNLISRGKIRLSLEAARRLIGPDCAYHLYSVMHGKKCGQKQVCGQMRGTWPDNYVRFK